MSKLNKQVIDDLIKDCKTPEDFFGENGLIKRFVKSVMESALNAELTTHLGYEKHDTAGYNTGNSRNGASPKTIKGEFGEVEVEVPRDRNGSYAPQLLPKHQTRFEGFDEKILSLYARGMTTRDIQAQLQDLYGVEVSHNLISNVTDAVQACPRISIALSRVHARQSQSRRRDNHILPGSSPSSSCYDPQLASRMTLRRFVYFS